MSLSAQRNSELASLTNPIDYRSHCGAMCNKIKRFGTCRGCKKGGKVLFQACGHSINDRSGALTGDKDFMSHDACAECILSDKHAANLRECKFCLEDKDAKIIKRSTPTGIPLARLAQSGFQADVMPYLEAFSSGAAKLAAGAAVETVHADVREGLREAGNDLSAFLERMRDEMGYDGDVAGGQESIHAFTSWLTTQRTADAAEANAPPAAESAERLAEAERRGAARAKALAEKAAAEAKKQADKDAREAKKQAEKEAKKAAKEIEGLRKTIAKKPKQPKQRASAPSAGARGAAGVPQRSRGVGETAGQKSTTKKATDQAAALTAAANHYSWFATNYNLTPGKGGQPGPAMLPQIVQLVGKLETRKSEYKAAAKWGDAANEAAIAEFRRSNPEYYTDEKLIELKIMADPEEEEEEEEDHLVEEDEEEAAEATGTDPFAEPMEGVEGVEAGA